LVLSFIALDLLVGGFICSTRFVGWWFHLQHSICWLVVSSAALDWLAGAFFSST